MSFIIEGKVAGDDLNIVGDVAPVLNPDTGEYEGGVTVTDPLIKAWLTVKTTPSVADPGTLQKVITTVQVIGTGQITQDGSVTNGNGTGSFIFNLTAADTAALGYAIRYYWDIQFKTLSGKIGTASDPEDGETVGRLQLRQGITDATS
jgi:hypothetical protein